MSLLEYHLIQEEVYLLQLIYKKVLLDAINGLNCYLIHDNDVTVLNIVIN